MHLPRPIVHTFTYEHEFLHKFSTIISPVLLSHQHQTKTGTMRLYASAFILRRLKMSHDQRPLRVDFSC